MPQRLSTTNVNTVTPGAYVDVTVRSTPVGIGAGGSIILIGEAASGPAYDEVDPKSQFFTPTQTDRVQQEYVSGNLVDAAESLAAPANDANIQGSVSRIYFLKTNTSTKASATIPSYGPLEAINAGKGGNQISYQITETQAEAAPIFTGDTIASFGATLDGAVINLRIDGGAVTTITLSGTDTDHDDITKLVTEIDGSLPAGISVSDGGSDNLVFTMDADATAYNRGYGRSFEISGILADLNALGLEEDVFPASAEPEQDIRIVRADTNVDETLELTTLPAFEVGYEGTTATLTIASGALSTTVVGGSGSDLSISLADYTTLSDLASFIDSQTGYSASVVSTATQRSPLDLDQVTAIDIASSITGEKPGRIKTALKDFETIVGTSTVVNVGTLTATNGLPAPTTGKVFLSGGAKGATTSADVVAALTKAESIKANFIVPLFSRDAADDIADALTESTSTYTIDAVHAAAKDHVLKMSTIKLKRSRISILSYKGDFEDALDKAGSLASFRIPMCFQDVDRLSSTQDGVVTFQPWMASVVAAGMQSAGFYRAIVKKYANITAFRDPSGFDYGNPGDVERALEGGTLFLEEDNAGNKWVSDQTTYGIDANFVYNSLQAVYLSDRLAQDLGDSVETRFVGASLADVDLGTVDSFIREKMEIYKNLKMIVASDDAELGYKGLKISISGPILEIKVEVKLATSIYFAPISIEISQVELSSAS